MKNPEDTITAPATFPAKSAVGIIRLSGKQTSETAGKIISFKGKPIDMTDVTPGKMYFTEIYEPAGKIDNTMFVFFKSPHSYTGEDMAEIHYHGNPLIGSKIISLLSEKGCRPAEPGEFTKRRFLNGKIDLSQAEAVADLIGADSNAAVEIGLNQLDGAEKTAVKKLRSSIIETLSLMEAEIDFGHEGISPLEKGGAKKKLKSIVSSIERLIENADTGIKLKTGFSLAITGKPNTGKSSLLNTLLSRDRAIVTDIPGTTRDTIEENITINNLPFKIIDTAGVRAAGDKIEKEGIKRTEEAVKNSDVIVFLIDGSAPLTDEDRKIFSLCNKEKTIIAVNKSDLKPAFDRETLMGFLSLKPGHKVISVSALKKISINTLTNEIKNIILSGGFSPETKGIFISNIRHKTSLVNALRLARSALANINTGLEMSAADIKEAADYTGEITGDITNDEILAEIFKKFCIGK